MVKETDKNVHPKFCCRDLFLRMNAKKIKKSEAFFANFTISLKKSQ
jgi:hypothetical protein